MSREIITFTCSPGVAIQIDTLALELGISRSAVVSALCVSGLRNGVDPADFPARAMSCSARLITALKEKPGATAQEIAAALSWNVTATSTFLHRLAADGKATRVGYRKNERGAPSTEWAVCDPHRSLDAPDSDSVQR